MRTLSIALCIAAIAACSTSLPQPPESSAESHTWPEKTTPSLRIADQTTTEETTPSEQNGASPHDLAEKAPPTEAKIAQQSLGKIHVHFGGIRLFGDAEPPTSPIKVKVYVGEKIALEGTIPVPTRSRYRRAYRADYEMVATERTTPLPIKVTSENPHSEATLLLKSTAGDWVHINYEIYSDNHPNKAQQGLHIEVHEAPQIYR